LFNAPPADFEGFEPAILDITKNRTGANSLYRNFYREQKRERTIYGESLLRAIPYF
jgi:hypothetical protein